MEVRKVHRVRIFATNRVGVQKLLLTSVLLCLATTMARGQAWRNNSSQSKPAWSNQGSVRASVSWSNSSRSAQAERPLYSSRNSSQKVASQSAWRSSGMGAAASSAPLYANQSSQIGGRSGRKIVELSNDLSRKGVRYRFGSTDPRRGLDCSATVQLILQQAGVRGVPRVSQAQYDWLARSGTLGRGRSASSVFRSLRPGHLMFWGGTYRTSNKVSHVMIYLGQDRRTGKHYMFGGRSSGTKGIHGHNVDVYEIKSLNGSGRFIGFGAVPGVRH